MPVGYLSGGSGPGARAQPAPTTVQLVPAPPQRDGGPRRAKEARGEKRGGIDSAFPASLYSVGLAGARLPPHIESQSRRHPMNGLRHACLAVVLSLGLVGPALAMGSDKSPAAAAPAKPAHPPLPQGAPAVGEANWRG